MLILDVIVDLAVQKQQNTLCNIATHVNFERLNDICIRTNLKQSCVVNRTMLIYCQLIQKHVIIRTMQANIKTLVDAMR